MPSNGSEAAESATDRWTLAVVLRRKVCDHHPCLGAAVFHPCQAFGPRGPWHERFTDDGFVLYTAYVPPFSALVRVDIMWVELTVKTGVSEIFWGESLPQLFEFVVHCVCSPL